MATSLMWTSPTSRLMRAATVLGITLVAMLPLRAAAMTSGAPRPCRAAVIDTATARRLLAHVERTHGRTPLPSTYVNLQSAAVPLVHRGRCLTAVTLSYDHELGGGAVIVDPSDPDGTPLASFDYPGATEPFAAGEGRLGLTYTHLRGYELYDSRIAIVCALDVRAWVECLSVTRDRRATVNVSPTRVGTEQLTDVELRGDTLLLRRRVTFAGGRAATRRPSATSMSRLVLPPVP